MACRYVGDRASHAVGLHRAKASRGSRADVRRVATVLVLAPLVYCLVVVPCLATVEESATGPAPRRHALLVGCTFYENLDERWWLEGPANDVALIRRLLTGHPFGFAASDIATLAGWPPDKRMRPTKENILREMSRLARVVGAFAPGRR